MNRDILVETVPGGAQNEHVVIESPYDWLPRGGTVLLEPARDGTYDNHMVFEGRHHHIQNVRVIDGHDAEHTRTVFEIKPDNA